MADHGTRTRYAGAGCRCPACTAANRTWTRNRTAELREARELVDGRWVCTRLNIGHGRCSSYVNYGCRCEPCAAAWRAYMADYWRRRRGALS